MYPLQIKLLHLEYRLFELGQYMEGHYMEGSSLVLYLQASENCLVQAKLLGIILFILCLMPFYNMPPVLGASWTQRAKSWPLPG